MLVLPKTYLVGYTSINFEGIRQYLIDTDQEEFIEDIEEGRKDGLNDGEILCSFYAKMCYASLTTKKNKNISQVRRIKDNIAGILSSGHGSVIEHCNINFLTTNCSRVFCFTPDTEIFTKNGWKKINDISDKETLLTKNSQTGYSEWEQNKKTHCFDYNGEIHWFESSQWKSPAFTDDHINWCAEYDKRKFRGKKCKEIKRSCKKVPYLEIKDKRIVVDHEIKFDNSEVLEIKIGDFTYNAKDFFFWLGLLVTDGTISEKKNICSIMQKKKQNISIIRNLFNRLFDERYKEYCYNEFYEFKIADANLKNFLIELFCGRKKSERKLCNLLDYNENLLTCFYEGAILGDGNIHKNGHRVIYCGYENLAKDWQVILASINKSSNIRIDDRRGDERKISSGNLLKNNNINYIISIHNKSESLIKKEHHKHSSYKGKVYCPETNNGLVYVRNEGMSFWSGNTHELVRHRVGTAFSQSSGRYIRTDRLDFVYDEILAPAKGQIEKLLEQIESGYKEVEDALQIDKVKDFSTKKKMTSAMRRILPNGQANEIGFTLNLRALRHIIKMRTSSHAEWEIRLVFNQVYDLVKEKYPGIFSDVIEKEVDGLLEISFQN